MKANTMKANILIILTMLLTVSIANAQQSTIDPQSLSQPRVRAKSKSKSKPKVRVQDQAQDQSQANRTNNINSANSANAQASSAINHANNPVCAGDLMKVDLSQVALDDGISFQIFDVQRDIDKKGRSLRDSQRQVFLKANQLLNEAQWRGECLFVYRIQTIQKTIDHADGQQIIDLEFPTLIGQLQVLSVKEDIVIADVVKDELSLLQKPRRGVKATEEKQSPLLDVVMEGDFARPMRAPKSVQSTSSVKRKSLPKPKVEDPGVNGDFSNVPTELYRWKM